MQNKTTNVIRVTIVTFSFLFGFFSLWISYKGLNLASEQSSDFRFFIFSIASCISIIAGGLVVIFSFTNNVSSETEKEQITKKDIRNIGADKLMLTASLIVIALMATYIYLSEIKGVI